MNIPIINAKANKALKLAESVPEFEILEADPVNPEPNKIYLILEKQRMPASDYFFRFDAMELGLANNDKVSLWDDLSGNDNNVQQSTAADQPTYLSTGLNGKPTVEFSNSLLMMSDFELDNTDSFTIFMFAQVDVMESSGIISIMDLSQQDYRLYLSTSGSSEAIRFSVNGVTGPNTSIATSVPVLYGFTYDSSTSMARIYENGSLSAESTVAGGAIDTHNTLAIGRRPATTSLPLHGKISEIIYFSRLLDNDEMHAMSEHLKDKWGI